MIKLARIDDRLVHGQVAFTWVSSLGIDCLVVANDKIAKDEFQKMAMGLAKPPMVKLLIMTLTDSIAFLNDNKSKNCKNTPPCKLYKRCLFHRNRSSGNTINKFRRYKNQRGGQAYFESHCQFLMMISQLLNNCWKRVLSLR